jgi:adenylyltransferase/sulfurtransferase
VALAPDQIRRYARHVLLPDVGGVGQARLLAATVVVPDLAAAELAVAVVYLAAAGVGRIAVAEGAARAPLDDAAVATGIAYVAADRGRAAAEVLAAHVAALNPDCALASGPHAGAALTVPAIPLAPIAGAEVADALVRAGAAACTLLHHLATSA